MEEMTMVEKKMEVKLDDGKVDGNDIDDNLDENKKEDRKGNNKKKMEIVLKEGTRSVEKSLQSWSKWMEFLEII